MDWEGWHCNNDSSRKKATLRAEKAEDVPVDWLRGKRLSLFAKGCGRRVGPNLLRSLGAPGEIFFCGLL